MRVCKGCLRQHSTSEASRRAQELESGASGREERNRKQYLIVTNRKQYFKAQETGSNTRVQTGSNIMAQETGSDTRVQTGSNIQDKNRTISM